MVDDKNKTPGPCPFCGCAIILSAQQRGCGYEEYCCDDSQGHECQDCDTWSANWFMIDTVIN